MNRPSGVFVNRHPGPDHDQDGEYDHEDPVIPQNDVADREIAEEPGRRVYLDIVRSENQTEQLLHDERNAPGREQ